MKWIDKFLQSISAIAILVTGVDALLGELHPVPIIFAFLLIIASASFYYLKFKMGEKPYSKVVLINRIILVICSLGIVFTLWIYRSTPSLKVHIDKISRFEIIKGTHRMVYQIAGYQDGLPVFGRGQRIRMTLKNTVNLPIEIISLRLRLKTRQTEFPPELKYNKSVASLMHTRLPIEKIKPPIRWDVNDVPNTLKEVGDGRIRLGNKSSSDDVHQIEFDVEALASGLWKYQIEVEYIEPKTGNRERIEYDDPFFILLRGR